MLKKALSIDEQVDVLNARGLIITDREKFKTFLLHTNYYRVNYYFHRFLDGNNGFIPGTSSKRIIAAYSNDHWLRTKIAYLLCPIEISVKSCLAHHLAIKYGADCFYQKQIFNPRYDYDELRDIFERELRNKINSPVVRHHIVTYGGKFPIWVVVEFLTFSAISKFFSNLLTQDRKDIGGILFNVDQHYLKNWLRILSILRNICAHHGHLFRRKFSQPPTLMQSFGWDKTRNDMLFAQFLIMKELSDQDIWREVVDAMSNRELNIPYFKLSDYGFPANWIDFLG